MNEEVWIVFIYVALRGPRCPHTQQHVESVTAGHNTSHISCLSHMAVLAWPWLLPHLPSPPQSPKFVFPTCDWLPRSPYCVAISPPKLAVLSSHALFFIVMCTEQIWPSPVQAQSPSYPHNLSSIPPPWITALVLPSLA